MLPYIVCAKIWFKISDRPNEYMKNITSEMWTKFNKYQVDFNLLLAIDVVLNL